MIDRGYIRIGSHGTRPPHNGNGSAMGLRDSRRIHFAKGFARRDDDDDDARERNRGGAQL